MFLLFLELLNKAYEWQQKVSVVALLPSHSTLSCHTQKAAVSRFPHLSFPWRKKGNGITLATYYKLNSGGTEMAQQVKPFYASMRTKVWIPCKSQVSHGWPVIPACQRLRWGTSGAN